MQVAGLDPDKVEYAMRTHDGKVWVQKINVTSVGVKEVLLRMAEVKKRASSGHVSRYLKDYLRLFGAQNIVLTKEERVTVIHCLHNLESCYESAVKQKLLAHRDVFSSIVTVLMGEEMPAWRIDRSKIKLKWNLDEFRKKIEHARDHDLSQLEDIKTQLKTLHVLHVNTRTEVIIQVKRPREEASSAPSADGAAPQAEEDLFGPV